MTRYHLSVLVPARNEYYLDIDLLHETVVNVLANTSNRTQLVVVLDGYTDSWPKSPLPVNDRLTVIHHRQSIGQRAATNEAARVATGEYLMKLDAHTALDDNFDEKLLSTFEPHWTVVPAQYNLLAFNWKCKQCGNLRDQGPKPDRCAKCNSRFWKQVKQWIPRDGREGSDGKGGRRNSLTHSWRFDSELNFAYWGSYAADEKHCKKHKLQFRPETQQPIHDTMSLLGACWAIRRERYFELDICEEAYGSWGDQGTEISCKTWLSGGELKCNTNTWFAHFFRVGGLGFPYPDGGRKERAKARGKEVWLNNRWPKQIYPLSWLIEKFKPLPDWHVEGNPVLAQVNATGAKFRPVVVGEVPSLATNSTPSHSLSAGRDVSLREQVASDTVSLSSVDNGGTITTVGIDGERNKVEMQGIATSPISTEMIQGRNIASASLWNRPNGPSVDNAVGQGFVPSIADPPVPCVVQSSDPVPAAAGNNLNLGKDSNKILGVQGDSEILLGSHDSVSETGLGSGPEPRIERDSGPSIVTRKPRFTCLFYTCNSHDETLELACRNNLRRSVNGYEIGCVARERTDFGDWSIVIDQPKGPLTMHRQILAGLERSTADYVFFCENDVLYHPSHFEFVPPRDDRYYYNVNVWRVRYEDGFAIRTSDCKQLSGLCANRNLLLRHYRTRVERISKDGFSRRNGYEPGTRHLPDGYDNHRAESWSSSFPNLDIKDHGATVTKGQWSPNDFRNNKFAIGWQETNGQIPPWPLFYGRLQEWLKELADGSA